MGLLRVGGVSFGNKGYINMKRGLGASAPQGTCGIASDPSFAIKAKGSPLPLPPPTPGGKPALPCNCSRSCRSMCAKVCVWGRTTFQFQSVPLCHSQIAAILHPVGQLHVLNAQAPSTSRVYTVRATQVGQNCCGGGPGGCSCSTCPSCAAKHNPVDYSRCGGSTPDCPQCMNGRQLGLPPCCCCLCCQKLTQLILKLGEAAKAAFRASDRF